MRRARRDNIYLIPNFHFTITYDLRVVEGRVARRYWEAFGKAMPEHLDFQAQLWQVLIVQT